MINLEPGDPRIAACKQLDRLFEQAYALDAEIKARRAAEQAMPPAAPLAAHKRAREEGSESDQ